MHRQQTNSIKLSMRTKDMMNILNMVSAETLSNKSGKRKKSR